MRRTTIAVFVLVLTPASALACYDHPDAGWFKAMPANSWELLEASREADSWEELTSLWVIAAGTASLALIGVSFRAFSRATDRSRMQPVEPAARPPLALPFDSPSDRTISVDQGHQPGEPAQVVHEHDGRRRVVAAGVG